jgi:hypothetical protein
MGLHRRCRARQLVSLLAFASTLVRARAHHLPLKTRPAPACTLCAPPAPPAHAARPTWPPALQVHIAGAQADGGALRGDGALSLGRERRQKLPQQQQQQ